MSLAGLTILALEDEPVIGLALEDLLIDAGADCRIAATLRSAEALLAEGKADAALLDVNISGTTSYGFAASLRQAGVPFVFCTGYGGAIHPPEYADVPTVAKPYSQADLEAAFARLGVGGE